MPPPTATPVPPPPHATADRRAADRAGAPQINFWADRTQINQGECATLNWDVHNVQAVWVYPQGADFNAFPRTGQGNERVCPCGTTTYEMRVQLTDGSTQFRQVTINVAQPIAPPQPPPIAPVAGRSAGRDALDRGELQQRHGRGDELIPGTTITLDFDSVGPGLGQGGVQLVLRELPGRR